MHDSFIFKNFMISPSVCFKAFVFIFYLHPFIFSQEHILNSWNDGHAKQAIIQFVKSVTDRTSSTYLPPGDRIATFDQDGTLWVEQPIYTQMFFVIDRVKSLAYEHPEWKDVMPFQTILSGDWDKISQLSKKDWEQLLAATFTGMSTEDFFFITKKWMATALHPRFKRPFTQLVYQPMKEVIQYLQSNGFKTYIVTGGTQDFVRVMSQSLYGIPPEQVIGSSFATRYEYRNNQPILMKLPKMFFIDNYAGKAIGINLFIGKRPSATFGNSIGDKEMLEWTQAGGGAKLMMLVYHDDPVREYAYGPAGGLPDTNIGTFSDSLMKEAKDRGWVIISMKKDWKTIFSFDPVESKFKGTQKCCLSSSNFKEGK